MGPSARTRSSRTTRTPAAARSISTFSNSILNEFRFQWAREDRPRPYDGPRSPAAARPFPDTGIDFGGATGSAMPFFIPVDDHDTRLQFNENLTYIMGKHTIKAGVEYNRVEHVADVPRLRERPATSSTRSRAS